MFFIALSLSSTVANDDVDKDMDLDADVDECDTSQVINYLFGNEGNLLTVSTFVNQVEQDGDITFEHVIDVEFNKPYNVPDMEVKGAVEQLDGSKFDIESVPVEGAGIDPYTRIQFTFAHNEFTALNIKHTVQGTDTIYEAPLLISFSIICEEHAMKNYVFDFSATQNSSFTKSFELVSNTAIDANNDCEGENGCVSTVKYHGELNLTNDTFDSVFDPSSVVFRPGQFMNLQFKVKQNVDAIVTITSVKETIHNGFYNELVHKDYATKIISSSNEGEVHLQVKVMFSQNFTLLIEGVMESVDGGRRRVLAQVKAPAARSKTYYAGKQILVIPDNQAGLTPLGDVNVDQQSTKTSSNQTTTEEDDQGLYRYLFFGCVGLLVLFGAGVYAHRTFKKSSKDEQARLVEETEMSQRI